MHPKIPLSQKKALALIKANSRVIQFDIDKAIDLFYNGVSIPDIARTLNSTINQVRYHINKIIPEGFQAYNRKNVDNEMLNERLFRAKIINVLAKRDLDKEKSKDLMVMKAISQEKDPMYQRKTQEQPTTIVNILNNVDSNQKKNTTIEVSNDRCVTTLPNKEADEDEHVDNT